MPGQVYSFGPFRLDTEERLLLCDGEPIHLKSKTFDLLLSLVRNNGHLLTKIDLMEMLWPDSFVEEHNLAVRVFELRKALRESNDHPYIQTVQGQGYRFVSKVSRVTEQSDGLNIEKFTSLDLNHENGSKRAVAVARPIGILPFNSAGAEITDPYLRLGLADTLITKLSNLKHVIVRPTSAIRKYINGERDLLLIGRELKVTAILDGSIRRSGDRMRVTAQLVSIEDGTILWAEKFDEQFISIFDLEDSISEKVASALTLTLTGEEKSLVVRRHTNSSEAYEAYMKGQFFLGKKVPKSLIKGVEFFEQAIRIDPHYALAYVGLARSYAFFCDLNMLSPREALPKAKEYAHEALRLGKNLAEVHTVLANLKIYEWDFAGAEEEFKLAIQINPNLAIVHHQYSVVLRHSGRFDEAIAQLRIAQEIDPVSLGITACIGTTYHFARQYERAIDELRKLIELDMNSPVINFVLGLSYEQQGQYKKALAEYRKANAYFNDDNPEVLAGLGRVFALSGAVGKARALLKSLIARSRKRYIAPYYIALVYVSLGEKERALNWLEKSYQERDCDLGVIKVDPRIDSLRDHTRFLSLLQRIGLA